MSNEQNATQFVENWPWADQILLESEWGDTFEVDDCEFDPETGEHKYFDECGNCLIVNQYADIYPG